MVEWTNALRREAHKTVASLLRKEDDDNTHKRTFKAEIYASFLHRLSCEKHKFAVHALRNFTA